MNKKLKDILMGGKHMNKNLKGVIIGALTAIFLTANTVSPVLAYANTLQNKKNEGKAIVDYATYIYYDTKNPIIKVKSPKIVDNKIYTNKDYITLEGDVADNTLGYRFYINRDQVLNVEQNSNFSLQNTRRKFEKNIKIQNKDTIELYARDICTNEVAEFYTVILDKVKPQIKIEGVKEGEKYKRGSKINPIISTDKKNTTIETYLDGSTTIYDGQPINTLGEHKLLIKVRDLAGNEESKIIKFYIANEDNKNNQENKNNEDNKNNEKKNTKTNKNKDVENKNIQKTNNNTSLKENKYSTTRKLKDSINNISISRRGEIDTEEMRSIAKENNEKVKNPNKNKEVKNKEKTENRNSDKNKVNTKEVNTKEEEKVDKKDKDIKENKNHTLIFIGLGVSVLGLGLAGIYIYRKKHQ